MQHKALLDMSNIQLDGTHTPAKRGGKGVDYQGRKKCKTSNLLIITDSRGTPITCSHVIAGNHNDAHELCKHMQLMLKNIQASGIAIKGLFLNADAGFDSSAFRIYCQQNDIVCNIASNARNKCNSDYLFDDKLYRHRFVIERTNAWLDGFKALLVRFETNPVHWRNLVLLSFLIILLRQL